MKRFSLRIALSVSLTFMGALGLQACSRPDPTVILGKWKAESFSIDGLKVPLAPNFEVTRSELILMARDGAVIQKLKLSEIRAEKDNIELEIEEAAGLSLVFSIENGKRIHFRVPFIGTDIAFDKAS